MVWDGISRHGRKASRVLRQSWRSTVLFGRQLESRRLLRQAGMAHEMTSWKRSRWHPSVNTARFPDATVYHSTPGIFESDQLEEESRRHPSVNTARFPDATNLPSTTGDWSRDVFFGRQPRLI